MKKTVITLILLFKILTTMSQDGDWRFDVFMDDLKEAQADANVYTSPKDRTYFIRPALEDWLARAVSKSNRAEWLKNTSFIPEQRKAIDKALDNLAATAAKKISVYKPGPEKFAVGAPEEIQLIKDKITELADLTIHKIGIESKNWIIEKDDSGIPTGRRKWGYVWFRNNSKSMDHPYCRVYEMYVYQSYQGGGTYGASYGSYESTWLCGCP